MKPKKNPNAEIGRNSSLYFMIGLTSVLFITWQSFEVKFYEEDTKVSEVVQVTDELKEDVPITEMIRTTPPPPPPSAQIHTDSTWPLDLQLVNTAPTARQRGSTVAPRKPTQT